MTFLECVFTTKSQPKEPWISLPNKFDDTCSKFWSFVNQVHLVILLHHHPCPTSPTQIGLIHILLSCIIFIWFTLLLEHQSPLFNDFEAFLKNFNVTFGNLNKKCTSNIKIWYFCQRLHSIIIYASKFRYYTYD